jgi:hypothetical protein
MYSGTFQNMKGVQSRRRTVRTIWGPPEEDVPVSYGEIHHDMAVFVFVATSYVALKS